MEPQVSFGHFNLQAKEEKELPKREHKNEIQIEENTVEGDSSSYRKSPQDEENNQKSNGDRIGSHIVLDMQ